MRAYRKVLVTLFVVLCSTVLAMYGKLTGEFSSIAVAALVGFSAANAYEHHAGKPKA